MPSELEPLSTAFGQIAVKLSVVAQEFERAMSAAFASLQFFDREMRWMIYCMHTHRSALSEALKPW